MIVPFGFSVGDFFSAIGACEKIYDTFKACGSASTEYRNTLDSLQRSGKGLRQLEALALDTADLSTTCSSLIPMILDESCAFLDTVTKSCESIAIYDKGLGLSAQNGLRRRIVPTVRWGIHGVKEAAKFHITIGAHANRLSRLMVQLNVELSSISVSRTQNCQNLIEEGDRSRDRQYDSLKGSLADLQGGVDKLHLDIAALSHAFRHWQNLGFHNILDDINTKFEALNQSSEDIVSSQNSFLLRMNDLCTGRGQILKYDKTDLFSRQHRLPITSDIESQALGVWHFLLRCKDGLDILLSSTKFRSRKIYSGVSNRHVVRQTGSIALKVGGKHLEWLILRLMEVVQGCVNLLKYFIMLYPPLQLMLKSLHTIPQLMTNLSQENIKFEDVFGVHHRLPWQYFQHWGVFKEALRGIFDGRPGQQKVLSGQYKIMNATTQAQLMKSNWKLLSPGTHIFMSISINKIKLQEGRCPKTNCGGTPKYPKHGPAICSCGLIISVDSEFEPASRIIELDDDDNNETLQPPEGSKGPKTVSQRSKPRARRSQSNFTADSLPRDQKKESVAELQEEREAEAEELKAFRRVHFPPDALAQQWVGRSFQGEVASKKGLPAEPTAKEPDTLEGEETRPEKQVIKRGPPSVVIDVPAEFPDSKKGSVALMEPQPVDNITQTSSTNVSSPTLEKAAKANEHPPLGCTNPLYEYERKIGLANYLHDKILRDRQEILQEHSTLPKNIIDQSDHDFLERYEEAFSNSVKELDALEQGISRLEKYAIESGLLHPSNIYCRPRAWVAVPTSLRRSGNYPSGQESEVNSVIEVPVRPPDSPRRITSQFQLPPPLLPATYISQWLSGIPALPLDHYDPEVHGLSGPSRSVIEELDKNWVHVVKALSEA